MVRHRLAALALAVLLLTAGKGWLTAQESKEGAKGKHHDIHHELLEAFAAKLGLTSQQKEQIHKIHADFDHKMHEVEHQLWTLHHQEREALEKVLTKEQRAKVPHILHEEMDKEARKIADKLGLSEDQRHRMQKIRSEYDKKIHGLEGKKGEKTFEQVRHLRHEELHALYKELTSEQRAKVPGILRAEFSQYRNPATRSQHLRAIGDKLGLSPEQREKAKKIHAEYAPRLEKQVDQLHKIFHEEHEAIAKVLTADQRAKVKELFKGWGGSEK